MDLSESFWNNRYINHDIGWDLGQISPPLKSYFNQLTNKNLNILIPGGGNSYEAEYLFNNGFKNTSVIDLSGAALKSIKNRVPQFPVSQLIHGNYFDLTGRYDLIIEQTFFCAIDPKLRSRYAQKANALLVSNGKLVGILFDAPLNMDKPPFGGNREEYLDYFSPYFKIDIFEACHNSIESRLGKELFIKLIKR
ncbi:TPMT family class I SAM-dependent methyltransferase [Aestuariivivens sediminis]|uniref:TPMT family class I SAM-dependent methyltransferase n=1 Tax=Aestuariivivens sediminis TaxID=2913557 RepID=UPI001F5834FA|nr:TPMT family class I SAM-dependent methyltransferase [Aestuariivivens sediminis]